MRRSEYRALVLTCGLGMLGAACATVAVSVPVNHPAEVNLRGKNELVLGDIRGPDASVISALLEQAIVDSGHFKLGDRDHMNQLLQELQLSVSDLTDPASQRKLGKLMTGSILLTGTIERSNYFEDLFEKNDTCRRRSNAGATVPYTCVHRKRRGRAEVVASFDVIDMETGENLKPKRLVCRLESATLATDRTPQPIDGDALMDRCRNSVVERFMKAIAPWQEHINAPFLGDGNLPGLEVGINYAKQGLWDDAVATFEEAVKHASGRPDLAVESVAKATWDLGLAYEYTFRFDEAIEQVKKAYEMTHNEQFIREVKAIEKLRDEQQRLQDQAGDAAES